VQPNFLGLQSSATSVLTETRNRQYSRYQHLPVFFRHLRKLAAMSSPPNDKTSITKIDLADRTDVQVSQRYLDLLAEGEGSMPPVQGTPGTICSYADVERFVALLELSTGLPLGEDRQRWCVALDGFVGPLALNRVREDADFRCAILERLTKTTTPALHEAMGTYLDVALQLSDTGVRGKRWFSLPAALAEYINLAKSISNSSEDTEKLAQRTVREMLRNKLLKHRPEAPDLSQLLDLREMFPNLEEPITWLAQHLAVRRAGHQTGFEMPPLLLIGPPGIGKTYLACELSKLINAFPKTINMATMTSGFVLSGTDRKWGQAAAGLIVKAMIEGGSGFPIVILDEIDKATANHWNVLGPLFHLLDPVMAPRFVDEFLGFEIDTSSISWIATANEKQNIPEPLLDRFQCFDIPSPSKTQIDVIVSNMYRGMAGRITYLPPDIPPSWKRGLENASLREIGRELRRAIGRVALQKELNADAAIDFDSSSVKPAQRKRMGF
jgi:ATP-dependent Lon protease